MLAKIYLEFYNLAWIIHKKGEVNMKKAVWRFFVLFVLSVLAFNCTVQSGNDLRYFDTAKEKSGQIHLAILYPSFGSLHSLIKLKRAEYLQSR